MRSVLASKRMNGWNKATSHVVSAKAIHNDKEGIERFMEERQQIVIKFPVVYVGKAAILQTFRSSVSLCHFHHLFLRSHA